jgi:hypothetical protein
MKRSLKKLVERRGLYSPGEVAGGYEQRSELMRSIKCGECTDSNYQPLKNAVQLSTLRASYRFHNKENKPTGICNAEGLCSL